MNKQTFSLFLSPLIPDEGEDGDGDGDGRNVGEQRRRMTRRGIMKIEESS